MRRATTSLWACAALVAMTACPTETVVVYVPVGADAADVGSTDAPGDSSDAAPLADAPDASREVGADATVDAPATDGDAGTGISCVPDAWFCIDPMKSAKCNATGDGYAELWDCVTDVEVCRDFDGRCADVVCTFGDRQCASDVSYTVCRPDGTGFAPPVACGADQVCYGEGNCVLESCVGTVLFLVDVSGSMVAHWEGVKASIDALKGNNPFARFGLWTFPAMGGDGCGTNASPAVAIAEDNIDAIQTWFDTHNPYGATPLIDAYTNVLGAADSLFGADGGAVVVLSDGADTCRYDDLTDPVAVAQMKVDDLSTAAGLMYTSFDVKTYVIGYAYTGDPAQLDALATNGGTNATAFTPAGNESELANALLDVLDDLKVCLGQ